MMSHVKNIVAAAAAFAALSVGFSRTTRAAGVGDVFMIDFENNDWTIPGGTAGNGSSYNPILGNTTAAPYINSLISTNQAVNPAWGQVSYANNYHNDDDTNSTTLGTGGTDPNIHPSEPNYVWQESGSNLSLNNDNDPYGSGGSVATIANYLATNPKTLDGTTSLVGQNLTGLMQAKGLSWKSYQEGTNLLNSAGQPFNEFGGTLTNNVAPSNMQTVPLSSFANASAAPDSSYTNPYNGSHFYNFAAKHDGTLFFPATNGGNDPSTANVEASHYEALESLQTDLTNNTVGRYNLITPDQYNDMHTNLPNGYSFSYNGTTYSSGTGDNEKIAQGDNFLSQVIPEIMASQAYKNNGAIVIWTDETEGNQNDNLNTLMEIVISPLAEGSQTGTGVYTDSLNFDHSSDVATFQEIYQTPGNTPTGYLNNADTSLTGGAQDLADLFVSGTIPTSVPEPTTLGLLSIAGMSLLSRRRAR